MPKIEEDIWIASEGRQIPMNTMEDAHLQSAFHALCTREYRVFGEINELYNKINTYTILRKKLKKVAKERNIKLYYPDEKFPSPHWGKYFEAERKTDTMEPVTVTTDHS